MVFEARHLAPHGAAAASWRITLGPAKPPSYLKWSPNVPCSTGRPGTGLLNPYAHHDLRGPTGDRFVKDQKTLRWLQREFAAVATEMEGAAFAYTCQLSKIPFLVIRGLSDTADENAPDDFDANLGTVCQHSFQLLEQLIPGLDN